jgi:zinc and cadmium transporter
LDLKKAVMNLLSILAATLVAGIGSVWVAALLMRVGVRKGGRGLDPQHLLSLAAGALLATAFMHLLPEAFESTIAPSRLFAVLLFGVVFFFLLDKAELWHHAHEHHHGPHEEVHGPAHDHHAHGTAHAHPAHAAHAHAAHSHARAGTGAWSVLTGDSVHCFGDGILIASAFAAAHEVPHHIGDLVVLRQTSSNSRVALVKVSLAGTMTALGGLIGWWLVDQLHGWLPYFLVLASSSFVYVALADLIPQLQRRLPARQTAAQVAWLAAGIAIVTLVSGLAHADHDHDQDHDHDHHHDQALGPSHAAGEDARPGRVEK